MGALFAAAAACASLEIKQLTDYSSNSVLVRKCVLKRRRNHIATVGSKMSKHGFKSGGRQDAGRPSGKRCYKVTPGALGDPQLKLSDRKERSTGTQIRCHHYLTLLSSSFRSLLLSSSPSAQRSGTCRALWCPEERCFLRMTPELSPLRSLSEENAL